jgi:hypothetical protein
MSDCKDLESAIAESSGRNEKYKLQGIVRKETHIQDDKGVLEVYVDEKLIKREPRPRKGKLEKIINAIIEIDTTTTEYMMFLKSRYESDELPNNDEMVAAFAFPICDFGRLEFSLMVDDLGNLSKGKGKFRIMSESVEEIALKNLIGKKIVFDILPDDDEEKFNA